MQAMKDGCFTMGEVAARAGVSRQTLYLHFSGLAELAIEAARYADEKNDIGAEIAPIQAATTPHQLLHELAKFHGRYNPKIAAVVMGANGLDVTQPDVRAALDDRRNARRAGARAVAERLRAWGALAEEWTVEEAASWMVTYGSIPLWHEQVVEEGWSTDRYVAATSRAYCSVLLGSKTLAT